MKALIAPLAAAAGLVAFVAVFLVEATAFRAAVAGWAAHDLRERTRLAAATLAEPLATGDFAALGAFGAACAADGVRLTVFSVPGGGLVSVSTDSYAADVTIVGVVSEAPIFGTLSFYQGGKLIASDTLKQPKAKHFATIGDEAVRIVAEANGGVVDLEGKTYASGANPGSVEITNYAYVVVEGIVSSGTGVVGAAAGQVDHDISEEIDLAAVARVRREGLDRAPRSEIPRA